MNLKFKKICNYLLLIASGFFVVFVFVVLFLVGGQVSFLKQNKIFEEIRNISSIIFGVCGAWLAITYPKAISSVQAAKNSSPEKIDSELEKSSGDVEILMGFVKSMMISIIIISICLALPFGKEVVAKCPWLLGFRENLLGALFCLLGAITLTQLYLLVSTLKNTYLALKELKRVTAEAITKREQEKNKGY